MMTFKVQTVCTVEPPFAPTEVAHLVRSDPTEDRRSVPLSPASLTGVSNFVRLLKYGRPDQVEPLHSSMRSTLNLSQVTFLSEPDHRLQEQGIILVFFDHLHPTTNDATVTKEEQNSSKARCTLARNNPKNCVVSIEQLTVFEDPSIVKS